MIKTLYLFAIILTIIILSAPLASMAINRYVGGGGTPNYSTIQLAIYSSGTGDSIYVAPGTYWESIIIDRSVTLIGEGATINGDYYRPGPLVRINAPDVTIDGFEITHGRQGIVVNSIYSILGNLQILNCTIHDQIIHGIHLATNVTLASLSIKNTTVFAYGNTGLLFTGPELTNVLIENSSFGNPSSSGSDGIEIRNQTTSIGSFTMTGCSLSGNYGSGFSSLQGLSTFSTLTFNGVSIQNNTAGGIMLQGGTVSGDLNITNCTFDGNTGSDIEASTPDDFCNGVTLTARSTPSEEGYLWSSGETTQSIFLSIADYSAGEFYVYVTEVNGCTASIPAFYTYSPEEVAGSYTILGFSDVKLGEYNEVLNGSVGLTDMNKKADFKKYSSVAGPGAFVKSADINAH
ncbi:MAG: hypothetical protein IH596_07365 [Bacteroidales bacterium]|nr:hypothetical protein [Bacteroidales bacterium]